MQRTTALIQRCLTKTSWFVSSIQDHTACGIGLEARKNNNQKRRKSKLHKSKKMKQRGKQNLKLRWPNNKSIKWRKTGKNNRWEPNNARLTWKRKGFLMRKRRSFRSTTSTISKSMASRSRKRLRVWWRPLGILNERGGLTCTIESNVQDYRSKKEM